MNEILKNWFEVTRANYEAVGSVSELKTHLYVYKFSKIDLQNCI